MKKPFFVSLKHLFSMDYRFMEGQIPARGKAGPEQGGSPCPTIYADTHGIWADGVGPAIAGSVTVTTVPWPTVLATWILP